MARYYLFLSLLCILFLSAAAHGGDADSESVSVSPNLRSRSLILVKIWCLILVFVGTFAGGMSPYFMKWNEGFLVIGTQFAGGVFLGTALMHFLSDSNSTFEDLTSKEYPFAFMLASTGYLLTMAADSVVSFVYGKNDTGSAHVDVELQGLNHGMFGAIPMSLASIITTFCSLANAQDDKDLDKGVPLHSNSHLQSHATKASLPSATSLSDSILLIAALCFHSVFEGIAIGVAETEADAWRALWTVCLHKIFAAIAMGIALLKMMPDRPLLSCAAYAFAFAISSPIGVAIGIIIDSTTQGSVADWIYAISMGLACGVFVYVAINHLLAKGYNPQKLVSVNTPFFKFLAVLFGIGVIAVVMIWDT